MNIFYLDKNPQTAAAMHCDKHCVKMVLEYAQLLSTAHRVLDGDNAPLDLYKIAHKNHPSTIWVRSSKQHYDWLFRLFRKLTIEYGIRYGRIHNSWKKLNQYLEFAPKNIKDKGWTDPPQCMPDHCKEKDTIQAYRKYYLLEKNHFAKWKYSEEPEWFGEEIVINTSEGAGGTAPTL